MKKLLVLLLLVVGLAGCGGNIVVSDDDTIDLNNDGLELWKASELEVGTLKEANQSVKMSILEIDQETITVKLLNQSCQDCGYAQYFDLHVYLDDNWYTVPALPDAKEEPAIGYILEGYQDQKKIYNVKEKYGVLPSGKYRLVVEGLTVEFMVE